MEKSPSWRDDKGAQELGVMGRKKTGKQNPLTRGMLTLKKSQMNKKGRENQHELY